MKNSASPAPSQKKYISLNIKQIGHPAPSPTRSTVQAVGKQPPSGATTPKSMASMAGSSAQSQASTNVGKSADYPPMSMSTIKSKLGLASLVSKSLSILHFDESTAQSDLKSLISILQEKSVTALAKLKENQENKDKPKHELDFLDYFAAKDGLRYIGFLEQLQYNYENKCKATLYAFDEELLKESNKAKEQIKNLSEYHVYQADTELQDYDFGVIVDEILNHFPIEANKKLQDIVNYHNYGIKMILHWVYVIQRKTKQLEAIHLEAVAIELLADIMAPSYAIFVHFAEFIICMEGQDIVLNKMTKIYFAVNHCSYTTCRVLDALGPMLHYYEITSIAARKAAALNKNKIIGSRQNPAPARRSFR